MSLSVVGIQEILCIPIDQTTQTVNGVVFLMNKMDSNPLYQAEMAMCRHICRLIGQTLHASQIQESIQRGQSKAQTLLD